MRKSIYAFCLSLGVAIVASNWQIAIALPLQPLPLDKVGNIGLEQQLKTDSSSSREGWNESERQSLHKAINNSLDYLNSNKAEQEYLQYSRSPFNLDRVKGSLIRFRQLLLASKSPAELEQAVKQEFIFYQSVGKDNQGTVDFTC
jgi:membrane-bound lytic murein transglycosylase A